MLGTFLNLATAMPVRFEPFTNYSDGVVQMHKNQEFHKLLSRKCNLTKT
jgi:hypothetical protein